MRRQIAIVCTTVLAGMGTAAATTLPAHAAPYAQACVARGSTWTFSPKLGLSLGNGSATSSYHFLCTQSTAPLQQISGDNGFNWTYIGNCGLTVLSDAGGTQTGLLLGGSVLLIVDNNRAVPRVDVGAQILLPDAVCNETSASGFQVGAGLIDY
jgi:hypothetical protein